MLTLEKNNLLVFEVISMSTIMGMKHNFIKLIHPTMMAPNPFKV
jgi:hypothetical protein